MKPPAYSRLRKKFGSVKKSAKALGVTERTIYYREAEGPITKEAELALKYLLMKQSSTRRVSGHE